MLLTSEPSLQPCQHSFYFCVGGVCTFFLSGVCTCVSVGVWCVHAKLGRSKNTIKIYCTKIFFKNQDLRGKTKDREMFSSQ